MPPAEQINDPLPTAPHTVCGAPLSGGLSILGEVAMETLQLTLSVGLALALAGILCFGLIMSARSFTHAAKSSRQVAGGSSIESYNANLKTLAQHKRAVKLRERFVRDINEATKTFDLRRSKPGEREATAP